MRCACYCRFSTDKQNRSSIEDQLRKCREYAAQQQGWVILDEHVYKDEAMSGVGTDRPGLQRLLTSAVTSPLPFEVLLVDDTSRLSRNLGDQIHIVDKLRFAGIRFIAVSQGIDSEAEQSDVLTTVHGMVDSLYVKELAKKTHRGLEGKFLKGLSAGGRCYGYDAVETGNGKQLVVNESEAGIVRRIFDMSANGNSLKAIAKTLNSEKIPAPRPRKGRIRAGWCPSAVRAMLHNERYVGRVIWNRTRFVKVPGTNRRVPRSRPESEWQIRNEEALRIVSDELWNRVQERLQWLKNTYSEGRPKGLLSRCKHLLSGFLVCSECGSKLTIISTKPARYGCSQHFNRGTCSNKLLIRKDELENELLAELQRRVLQPEAVDYALRGLRRELDRQLRAMSGQVDSIRQRKQELDAELKRLGEAVAKGGNLPTLLQAIADRETELREISAKLVGTESGSMQASLEGLREYLVKRLTTVLRNLLYTDVEAARTELGRHITKPIVLHPENGHYVAQGEWHYVGPRDLSAEMVAGAGFEPATSGL
jgi:site-specific DNA recombinase